ncbi:DRAP deaminase [Blastocladiella emersonii ATCC 22665]|nr:DRAP deaminase [Blastocladiella emersonii ATCC 22665]
MGKRPAEARNGAGKRFKGNKQQNGRQAKESAAEEELSRIEYTFDNGLRRVTPYHYLYKTFAKQRWLGHSLIETFTREFADRPTEYYLNAIKTGGIQINGQQVDPSYVIQNSDMITHQIHRHEPPVAADPVTIIASGRDVVVINKPASIPVHPTGRYRHNTVLHLLQREMGAADAPAPAVQSDETAAAASEEAASETSAEAEAGPVQHPVGPAYYALHRLDRLTSGVMMLCSDRQKIAQLTEQFTKQVVGKEYLCRVVGEFPSDPVTVDAPIQVVSHKLSLNRVHPDGKPSVTHFERLAYNGTHSLVRARPVTGRTHQIRVHLRHLGHPIANDPLYHNPTHRHVVKDQDAWNEARAIAEQGKGEQETAPATADVKAATATEAAAREALERRSKTGFDAVEVDAATQAWIDAMAKAKADADLRVVGQCDVCGCDMFADPTPDDLHIYLHAYKYTVRMDLGLDASEHVAFDAAMHTTTIRSPLPAWAQWPGVDVGADLAPLLILEGAGIEDGGE